MRVFFDGSNFTPINKNTSEEAIIQFWCALGVNVYNDYISDDAAYQDYLYKNLSVINTEIKRWREILHADYQRWLLK